MLSGNLLQTSELAIHYAEGPDSGPPLVLLHGITASWKQWGPLIPSLEAGWRLLACDLRGHGRSGRAAGHYRVVDYVRDQIEFLHRCTAEPAVLVGHSLGGLAALGAAARAPESIRAIVLLDPPFQLRDRKASDCQVADWCAWVVETLRCASQEEVIDRCRELTPGAEETGARELAEMISSLDLDVIGVLLQERLLEGFDLAETLQQVSCPTLILRAGRSGEAAFREQDVDFVRAHLPSAEVIEVPGAGHVLHHDQPEFVRREISRFLRTV